MLFKAFLLRNWNWYTISKRCSYLKRFPCAAKIGMQFFNAAHKSPISVWDEDSLSIRGMLSSSQGEIYDFPIQVLL